MKNLIFIFGMLIVSNSTYSQSYYGNMKLHLEQKISEKADKFIDRLEIDVYQFTISNDSIFEYAEFIAKYKIQKHTYGNGFTISIFPIIVLNTKQKIDIQNTMSNRMPTDIFLEFVYGIDKSKLTPTQISGLKLEEAGNAYNSAVGVSIVGGILGSALVLNGEPIAGSIVTLCGGIIGFILQITGNNKLIEGGKILQIQK